MNSPEMSKRFLDTDALEELRRTADWSALCAAIGVMPNERKSKPADWWASSPFAEDASPSFHIKPNEGVWYCFSTRQGGGVIELVQRVYDLNCFEAGEWLIDQGVAPEPDRAAINACPPKALRQKAVKEEGSQTAKANASIRQSLLPHFSEQGTHEEFVRRGIGEKTCHYLGCGLLNKGRSRLKGRLVFQVGGIEKTDDSLAPTILTHIGRATTPEQTAAGGKWLLYKGFYKSLEFYNLDKALLDPVAREQIRKTGRVLIVEGPFDVAKLVEAGVCNVVATLGADLSIDLKPRLDLISAECGAPEFQVWYDRDSAGQRGQSDAISRLTDMGFATKAFDWSARFGTDGVGISEELQDPCDLSVTQIKWLRGKDVI